MRHSVIIYYEHDNVIQTLKYGLGLHNVGCSIINNKIIAYTVSSNTRVVLYLNDRVHNYTNIITNKNCIKPYHGLNGKSIYRWPDATLLAVQVDAI